MYIRKTTREYKGKTYTNHLLVESVQTPQGPRQRTICSLGSLEPAPAEDWLGLAHKIQSALEGQASLSAIPAEVTRLSQRARRGKQATAASDSALTVEVERLEIEEAREAGPVHVGHQVWRQLGLDTILGRAGLSPRACTLAEAMTLNRLICPLAEHAMPDWIRRTALGDILQEDFSTLVDEALYRNLDRLHPQRESIERELAEREKTLFSLDDTVLLYDLTSTYFEGQALANPQAQRGYSRDKRPDCKQVVVGLVLDREGFPKAHEVFDGNTQDRASLAPLLDVLEKRTGKRPGTTVIVDRGMAYDENLAEIRGAGITTSWRPDSRKGTSGWRNWKAKRVGKRSCARLRLEILFRRRRASRSSASRRATWVTSSAAAKAGKKKIEPFAKNRKRSCSVIWPNFSSA